MLRMKTAFVSSIRSSSLPAVLSCEMVESIKFCVVGVPESRGVALSGRRKGVSRARSALPVVMMTLPFVAPIVVFGRRPRSVRPAPAMPSCEIVEMSVLLMFSVPVDGGATG